MVEGGGNHVCGQLLGQPRGGQDSSRRAVAPALEGHQTARLRSARSATTHRGVADTGQAQQGVLDLADLDAEASKSGPGCRCARGTPVRPLVPAIDQTVAAAVEPRARPIRVRREGRPGALRVVDVPATERRRPEKTISPGAPSGTGHRCSSVTDTSALRTGRPSGTRSRSGTSRCHPRLVSSEVSVSP